MAGETISDEQRRGLVSLCDTFVPSIARGPDRHGLWARSASDLAVPAVLELILAEGDGADHQRLIKLLDDLGTNGFCAAPLARREAVLDAQRDAASVAQLRNICLTLFYGLSDGSGANPNWPAIRYPGPGALEPATRHAVEPIDAEALEPVVVADVCVVGSGAGGGVAAAILAEAGLDVVVLEMGDDFAEPDFDRQELTAYRNLYYRGGPFATDEDGQITMLAGSALGGGTTVNWSTCLRPPDHVRREWAGSFGLEGLDGADFDAHLDAIAERISVNDRCSDWNGANERLMEGCETLGYSARRAMRNAQPNAYRPETAGFIGYGDRSGSKQGTAQTYLRDAAEHGARIVVQCRAEQIEVRDGRVVGVIAHSVGQQRKIHVRTPRVVLSAGSLESPALLLRSGIGGPAVGRYLKLQPGAAVLGVYEEHQQLWWGAPQTSLCDHFADLGDGYGFLIECGGANAGLGASAQPWASAEQHKEFMERAWQVAPFLVFIRDRGEGQVLLGDGGRPVVRYSFSDERDRDALLQGMIELARLHAAAGAEEIYPVHRELLRWERAREPDLSGYLSRLRKLSFAPADLPLYATHLLCSARMGLDPETSVADPSGRLHDVEGAWVADASSCPTPPGVNPMLTTMALARRTATGIARS